MTEMVLYIQESLTTAKAIACDRPLDCDNDGDNTIQKEDIGFAATTLQ